MSFPQLRIEDLVLASSTGPIIQPVSFQINKGEIVALTGRSGSGKTSLALAILGVLHPGITLVQGQIVWYHGDVKLTFPDNHKEWSGLRGTHIGFVQQDVYGAFDPLLRMGKQMMMVIKEWSSVAVNEIEGLLKSILSETGIKDINRIWNSFPHQLSGGQLQRCQVAVAVALKPQLLIADEPTSAIDKINQDELLEVFDRLRKKYNIAILLITHDQQVVEKLADRIIALGDIVNNSKKVQPGIPSQGEVILECNDIRHSYSFGGLASREGAQIGPVSFELKAGSCLGIIGESGSGKSTIAQMLVGLIAPDSGEVIVSNKIIDFKKSKDIDFLRQQVQLVFQDGRGALHPHFSIEHLLRETSAFYTSHNPALLARPVLDVLSEVELQPSILQRKPPSLSGGECLRVNIARALLLKPAVLICDESTSALDSETRDAILTLLERLSASHGMALILITHDNEVIRRMAHQIIVMDAGKMAEQGRMEDVLRNTGHPLTKKIFSLHATLPS